MDGWMDGWIDLFVHPILYVIASIIYGIFRDQAAIFLSKLPLARVRFLLLGIYITQQTKKGFYYGLLIYVFLHVKYGSWCNANIC